MDHPHVHCIVPGGGLSFDDARAQTRWVFSRKKFFIPVKVLSRKFRGKFSRRIRKLSSRLPLKTAILNFTERLNLYPENLNFKC